MFFTFQAGCGTVSAVADCLSLFALFRVGAGTAAAGCLLSRFVYCMELSVTSNRTAAGFVSNIFMTLGYAILSLLAYFLRDWRQLMLAVSLPGALLLGFWWYVLALYYILGKGKPRKTSFHIRTLPCS